MALPLGLKKLNIDNFIIILIALSVLVVGAGMLLIVFSDELAEEEIFGSGKMEMVNFESLILTPAQNHYLACHEDHCKNATPDEVTEFFPVPVNVLRDRLTKFIDSQKRVETKKIDLINLQFVFLVYEGANPFPDVVTVKLYDLGAPKSGISILSQTLKGDDEKERNRQRVQKWLAFLKRP